MRHDGLYFVFNGWCCGFVSLIGTQALVTPIWGTKSEVSECWFHRTLSIPLSFMKAVTIVNNDRKGK